MSRSLLAPTPPKLANLSLYMVDFVALSHDSFFNLARASNQLKTLSFDLSVSAWDAFLCSLLPTYAL